MRHDVAGALRLAFSALYLQRFIWMPQYKLNSKQFRAAETRLAFSFHTRRYFKGAQ